MDKTHILTTKTASLFVLLTLFMCALISSAENNNSLLDSCLEGGTAGIAGGICAQTPNAIKSRCYNNQKILVRQNNQSWIVNTGKTLLSLQRGIIPFTASLTLGTITQTPLKRFCEQVMNNTQNQKLSTKQELFSVIAAGMLSATFVCPADFYMLKQQNSAQNLMTVIKKSRLQSVYKNVGITAFREIFSAGFLFSQTAADLVRLPTDNQLLYSLGGSIPVAVVTATLSSPIDKIKTIAQTQEISAWQAIKTINAQNGYKGFVKVKDIFWRNMVYLAAIPVMNFVQLSFIKKNRTMPELE